MRLSYKWLSEYVDLHDITPQELADKMTTAGLEVEGVEPMASATGLVIGEVLECYDHPDSDHLHITKTKIGPRDEDVFQLGLCLFMSWGSFGMHSLVKMVRKW